MNLLHSGGSVLSWLSAVGLLTVLFAVSPAGAVDTWDGDAGDAHWSVGGNWADGTAPAFTSNTNTDDVVFPNTAFTTVQMRAGLSATTCYDRVRSITFNADSPAYTFIDDYAAGIAYLYLRGSVGTAGSGKSNTPSTIQWTNNSANQQKVEAQLLVRVESADAFGYGGLNLNNAIMSGETEIANLWVTSDFHISGPTSLGILKVFGPGDIRVDGNFGYGGGSNTNPIVIDNNTPISVAGGFASQSTYTGGFQKRGSGVITLNGPAPTASTPLPHNPAAFYGDFNKKVVIGDLDSALSALTDAGAIRIANATALGVAGDASTAYTEVRGGLYSNGRLELAGGISTAEFLILQSRGGANTGNASVVNYGGANTLSGGIQLRNEATSGTDFAVESNADVLALSGNVNLPAGFGNDAGGNVQTFTLAGPADGLFSGNLTKDAGTVSLGLKKTGSGTWEVSGTAHTFDGGTTVAEGTMVLTGTLPGDAGVADGALLKGTGAVSGDLATAAGSALAPGTSIGTLTVAGDATLGGTLDVEYDGANEIVDVLSVSGALDIDSATVDFSDFTQGTATLDLPYYVFATYGSLTGGGEFAAVNNTPTGYNVAYGYLGNNIALVAIPEPSTLLLLFVAALMGLGARSVRGR
jgi:autotransporter-associated beta strand protein